MKKHWPVLLSLAAYLAAVMGSAALLYISGRQAVPGVL